MPNSTPRWLQKMRRDAVRARRAMIREGELLNDDDFRRRRGITSSQLARLNASGSVFFIEVDGKAHYPRVLVDPAHNLRRLASVCRVLWPAPPVSRLDFLTSRHDALGGITPLEALEKDDRYRKLRIVARGWASEFSRTTVEVCAGEFGHGLELPTVCAGIVEIDPRTRIWRRAAAALRGEGNLQPDGPYCQLKAVSVFISRGTAGKPGEVLEARLDVIVSKGVAHTGVVTNNYPRHDLSPVRIDTADDIVTVVLKVLARAV